MAIGDGENDIEMLELASLGISLSNGSEKTKAVANIIGASNDEDGVADAIYRYAFWGISSKWRKIQAKVRLHGMYGVGCSPSFLTVFIIVCIECLGKFAPENTEIVTFFLSEWVTRPFSSAGPIIGSTFFLHWLNVIT